MRDIISTLSFWCASIATLMFVAPAVFSSGAVPAEQRTLLLSVAMAASGMYLISKPAYRGHSLTPLGTLLFGIGILMLIITIGTR